MRSLFALIVLLAVIAFDHQSALAQALTAAPCGDADQAAAEQAKPVASGVLDAAIRMLENADDATKSKFVDWFGGTATEAEISPVLGVYRSVRGSIDQITFECYAEANPRFADTLADVDKAEPYKIALYPRWFEKPMDAEYISKSGNLIHEMTHFKIIAGTDDIRGGGSPREAHLLTPDKAKRNANNYAFLAEALAWNLDTP